MLFQIADLAAWGVLRERCIEVIAPFLEVLIELFGCCQVSDAFQYPEVNHDVRSMTKLLLMACLNAPGPFLGMEKSVATVALTVGSQSDKL